MLRFARSETPLHEKKPRLVDGATTKAWLAAMPQPLSFEHLAEITQAVGTLGALGAEESAEVLSPQRKFAIADRIRAVLVPLLGGSTHDDRFTVLPLDDEFNRQFWGGVDALVALRDVYAWLVTQLPRAEPASAAPDGAAADHGGVAPPFMSSVAALHRAVDLSAQMMVSIQRARWAVPPILWDRHCVLGQLIRELDCQDVDVVDAQRLAATRTCRSAFVLPVMIALADSSARNSAEFEVIRMAAQRWSAKVGFRLERRNDPGASPARPIANPGPTATLGAFVLRFDTQSALQSIDKRLEALAEGRAPRDVGIGETLRPQAARELLQSLKQRWGAKSPAELDSPDRAWRPSASGTIVMAMVGMPTRESLLTQSGHGLGPQLRAQKTYAYQRMKEGAVSQPREHVEHSRIDRLLEHAETWTLLAESSDAVRCVRKHARPRIGLQRLVGLKLGSANPGAPFLLGWVEALQGTTALLDDDQIRSSSAHHVRVRLAPGLPQAVVAASDDVEFDCAFLLVPGREAEQRGRSGRAVPFVRMLSDIGLEDNVVVDESDDWDGVRASPRDYGLILPLASFRPQRLVRVVRHGAVAMLRLEELMMRGSDFDLVRFSL